MNVPPFTVFSGKHLERNSQCCLANGIIFVMQVSVRPYRHNEFERFLVAAYPYYMSVFSTMAAFFVFGIVFLYHK